MDMYNNSTEEMIHFMRILYPSAFLLVTIAVIGIYGHISIIWATVKFRYLQNPCNILIAILAIGDFGHQLGHFPYAFFVVSGITIIPQRSCYWIQLIPALFTQHTVANIIGIGIDRFICIACPIWYRSIGSNKRKLFGYLLTFNIIPVAYSIFLAVFSYSEMEKEPQKETLCLIAAFFAGRSAEVWALSTAMLTGFAVLLYIVIWITVWKKTHVVNNVKNILKALTMILFLTFFGWFIGMTMVTIISQQTNWSENLRVGYMSYAGISINSSIAANYFVYKRFGSDYKKAFRNLWKSKNEITVSQGCPSNTINASSHHA